MVEASTLPVGDPEVAQNSSEAGKDAKPRYTSFAKEILQEGNPESEHGEFPQPGHEVKVHYTGTLASNGDKFDSSRDRGRVFQFVIGEGRVITGWDEGVSKMRKGERAMLRIPAEMGYGENGSPPVIPADADLDFDVELIDFGPKPKEKWELSDAEKLAEATSYKEKGNEAFKAANYEEAVRLYEEAMTFVNEDTMHWTGDMASARDKVVCSVNLNLAQCRIKRSEFVEGLAAARAALDVDQKNEKALFRTAFCAMKLEDFDFAKQVLNFWIKECGGEKSAEARKLNGEVKEAIKVAKEKAKSQFGGIFANKSGLYTEKVGIRAERNSEKMPKVYFDIEFEDEPEKTERVTFALYNDTVPKTVKNFQELCEGKNEGLKYEDSCFHRVIPGFMMQGGDFTNGDGTGGKSIYGEKFDDENLTSDKHEKPYLLSMANAGPNTNGSQFFITFAPAEHLDGKHVVFGEVIDGIETVKKIEQMPTGEADVPAKKIKIKSCGLLCATGCC